MTGYPGVVGQPKEWLDTPALLVDLDVLDRNTQRVARTCREAGINWRPHTKGIKIPAIAHKLLAAGAMGVTCAKLGEAELMAGAGIRDILVANQVVGPAKIARLVNLLPHADVIVAVDSIDNVDALDAAAREKGVRPRVVVEVNIGLERAGVEPGEPVVALARVIAERTGLRFAGLMGWEGHTIRIPDLGEKRRAIASAVGQLTSSAEACRAAGLPVEIVSCGGTGTYWITAHLPGITEIQAGGGVFCDILYRQGMGVDHEYALTVLTTVTSRPNPTRIICDAGKKTMSSDGAVPEPIGVGKVKSVSLSAEHARIDLDEPNTALRVGDRVEFIVGYSDTTVHLHPELYGIRNGRVETVWPVLGRGLLR
ncbi:MAG: DSD1 family PLP-dependent enzyme [Chloroflexi bacterium]|nr:DSD1 family PLP-dependent enzyme [Chloroflexota bacterium]